MTRSMTGYGKAEAVAEKKKFTVEVRSLNSRQLDLSVKLPSAYRACEADIRTVASQAIVRGKADIYITVENLAGTGNTRINEQLFAAYYENLKTVGLRCGIDCNSQVVDAQLIASVMRMPEVVSTQIESVPEHELELLNKTVSEALGRLDEFRRAEGGILIADILGRVGKIEDLLSQVHPYEAARVDAVRARIKDHIASLDLAVDENRLEQELVYYIEKLDITEEKVRLANHCSYFREVVSAEEYPGRKLGFIGQEMGREINTLGSKANDSDIQRIVVQMKDELEKIKEQLLNVL